MKLLMVSGDRSILQGKRGAFWYTLQELRKHFDRIDILCPRATDVVTNGNNHHHPAAIAGGGEVHFHPCPLGLWYQSHWIVKQGKTLFREHHHDVMTVHEYPPFYNGRGALRLHRATGIPFVLEVHHVVGIPAPASFAERLGRWLSRWVLPRHARAAAAVRVVNTAMRDLLCSWGIPAEKVQIVSSFYLDRELLAKDVRPPISYDVSFCGRLVPNKQLALLIEAIADMPEIRLLVVGDGPERARCEALARKLSMQERATFLGWMPSAEAVIAAVQTARIFVMNSSSEGGPRSALEAMGCGMPVVATPVGIMPEIIEDGVNGVFTDGSKGDLRRKITRLLQDEALRNRLGAEARKVLDRFDRVRLIRQYADFLQSIARHS
ncbi:MAG: glycosyltransferase [Candidatus Peribacteraceae bacterium]|nr:glycosyltransferase [Candidatus Peribacteraceae bacterium]